MTPSTNILCIGSVLWDVIGHAPTDMRAGSDVPGRISQLPGGVAMNVAMTLRRLGMTPILLSAVGKDADGVALIAHAQKMGLNTDHIYRSPDLPTDRYMAVEGANGLIAAIADAHSLEAAGDKILAPLSNGQLGSPTAPYTGAIALDGNLTKALLSDIATSPLFANADLRVAPASPGKAERLQPLLKAPNATLYVNLEEAGLLCQTRFDTAPDAAQALLNKGPAQVLVTNGSHKSAHGKNGHVITAVPPHVQVTRITGAGDAFMAAHIASDTSGADPETALVRALRAAADYVSKDVLS